MIRFLRSLRRWLFPPKPLTHAELIKLLKSRVISEPTPEDVAKLLPWRIQTSTWSYTPSEVSDE